MHAERSREVSRLRNVAAELEDDIAALQRERANLIGQPQALADVTSNFVAEAGYPTAGAQGQYIVLEGKAKDMPFCGFASLDTPLSARRRLRSEEHTSELQSLMRISYAVFCLKKKNNTTNNHIQ